MKTLLLKMSGPLQTWGTSSRFETRHTDFYPSKSAIIGIISACLGYKRDDNRILKLNELDFAVRIDQDGNIFRDYHIAQKFKPNGDFDRTYVTNRYYMEDAVCIVSISHSEEIFIKEIENALRYPYFQPFMGRRSIPLPLDFIIDSTDDSAVESLKNLPWQAMEWYKKRSPKEINLSIYADADLIEGGVKNIRRDKVISFSQKERKFGPRYESRIDIIVTNPYYETEHDVFNAIGG